MTLTVAGTRTDDFTIDLGPWQANEKAWALGSDGLVTNQFGYFDETGWTTVTPTGISAGYTCRGIAYGNGVYVGAFANDAGTMLVYSSTDGVAWTFTGHTSVRYSVTATNQEIFTNPVGFDGTRFAFVAFHGS